MRGLHQRWLRRLTVVGATPGVLLLVLATFLSTCVVCANGAPAFGADMANVGSRTRVLSSSPHHAGQDDSCDGCPDVVVVVHVQSGDLRVARRGTVTKAPENERRVEFQRQPLQRAPNLISDDTARGTATDADDADVDVVAHLVVALDPTAGAGACAHHPSITIIISSLLLQRTQLPNR
jgi:hypothetical protein